MIAINHLTVDFTGTPLFDDISFLINPKEKIALVGKNGAGKTTMLKIFAGIQQPTKGVVTLPKGTRIGYLPQQLLVTDETTLLEDVRTVFADINNINNDILNLNSELSNRTDYESDDYQALIERLTLQNERLQMLDANNMDAQIEKTLIGLGFRRSDFTRHTSEFSGGWRMRIELAKILLARPDLLLLDEPTNHLDIESITWLEQFLSQSQSALVLVSHDRAFLDAVTSRTIEISLGRIYDYKACYSKYVALRAERREQLQRAYENQQKIIADTEEFIERFRYKATKAVQVQSRIKQLEKMERIELDVEDTSALRLKFPPAPHCGAIPVKIENLTKRYGNNLVLKDLNLEIPRGKKVAFVGRNGEGKTTLVKCINSEVDFEGSLRLAQGVKIGYFAQNQASLLDENLTVFDTIDRVAVGDIRLKIRQLLGEFMFDDNAIDRPVRYLSGGERSRLAMIKLLLEPANLLILDEPTNHLDMKSKDVLKQAISKFDGTVILVSHDRDFLDSLVDSVYEFANHNIKQYDSIQEFLDTKKIDSMRQIESPTRKETSIPAETVSENKNAYEQRKDMQRNLRKIENNITKIENEIADLEAKLADIEGQFANGVVSDELTRKYASIKHTIEQKMYEWELMEEEHETINAQLQ